MPDEALSIQHIQDKMTKKYEDPSEKFITRIIERQLLPPTNPDHREPPETAEQFKESIYDLIRARNKANPAKRNVDPNLTYRGKDSKGDDPNASKNKKSDNDATTPSSKVVDEVDEEAVGAVTGSKSGNKQQQQKKQESGNKPPCGVCPGKYHYVHTCPVINATPESRTAYNTMISSATKHANDKPKFNKRAQHDANVAALSDRLDGIDLDDSTPIECPNYYTNAACSLGVSAIRVNRESVLYDPGAQVTVFNDISIFDEGSLDFIRPSGIHPYYETSNVPYHAEGHIAGLGRAYYCSSAVNLISSGALEWLGWNFEADKDDNFTNFYTATVKGSDYAVIFDRFADRWHAPLSEVMKLCKLNARRLNDARNLSVNSLSAVQSSYQLRNRKVQNESRNSNHNTTSNSL